MVGTAAHRILYFSQEKQSPLNTLVRNIFLFWFVSKRAVEVDNENSASREELIELLRLRPNSPGFVNLDLALGPLSNQPGRTILAQVTASVQS